MKIKQQHIERWWRSDGRVAASLISSAAGGARISVGASNIFCVDISWHSLAVV